MVKHITDTDFDTQIAEGLTFVDFWAPWCGPCKMLGPVIDELSTEFEGKIKIAKLNVDENQITAQKYGIMSIPTMILFENGKPVEKVQGFHPKQALHEYLSSKI
ncbi:thioredoxin [Erysipelothrix sp. HDW6A]|uniref:thioredoxin n=1 Tax=Erysipelothrix sp. HDW6A TaxID=2714928 RepID=UPI00140CF278|nr:thioredoxin [Erysipelothrix sp. HDW6A]QIK57144.1 thioredoxin [Erysipelothrix sp. HDW6A]